MYAAKLYPANGGVVVELDQGMVATDVHYSGRVVMKGSGVPWLIPGNRVVFPSSRATPIEVMVRGCSGLSMASGDPEERTTVFLVDQRDIHATTSDPEADAIVALTGMRA